MSQYFPKPYEPFSGDINVKVDLSNYATKTDIKNISHVDRSSLALKIIFANLKTEVDKLDIDKLVPVPAKITEIENKIPDINNLATKPALTTVENKIPDTSNLVKKIEYDTKIREIENKYVSNTGFDSKLAQILMQRLL